MWNIYGKKYDLTTFIKIHPGGSEILIKTKGLDDCTALFESYHAFSNIESIRKSLDKYEILEKDSDIKNEYDTDFTTYHKLIEKVKAVYPNRESIKASTSWYLWNTSSILLYIYVISLISTTIQYTFLKCFFSVIASSIEVSILFNLLHDASHYAISTNPIVNNVISKLANSWVLWNHSIWFYQHIYYHHSFTGSKNDTDKDMYSISLLLDVNKYISSEILVNVIYCILPGQTITQSIWYIYSSLINQLSFTEKADIKIPNSNHYDIVSLFVMFCKIYMLYNIGVFPSLFYIITENTLYYINIIADHDLYETHENYYDGTDWAKRQICNSGNFINENREWTMAFSGINHQIEHHLFPNICGHNYTYIAPIVKEFCKENNLPYVHQPTFFGAYKSFMKKIKTS
jgi:linoleoyl-CoA desaturase